MIDPRDVFTSERLSSLSRDLADSQAQVLRLQSLAERLNTDLAEERAETARLRARLFTYETIEDAMAGSVVR